MRALLVDPSSRGGIAAYTALVARALRAAGVDASLLASSALAVAEDPVPVARRLPAEEWGRPERAGPRFYAGRASAWTRAAAIVARAAARERPDVVHLQAPLNRRFDALLLRRLARRRPVVWTAHDVLPFERTEHDRARFAAIYRAVDRVIVHTAPAAEEVRALAGVEATVIEHPVPDDVVRTERASARRELGLPADGRLLAALGFIRAYKGYDLLADVWERLGADAPPLLVMGEQLAGAEADVLERLARCERVELRLGYASDRELQLAASAADALLLPYTTASDSGLVHLARAAGVPVIASDAPQLAASVTATGAGAVVPRDVGAWADAVRGELPPAPPPAPSLAEIGARHLAVYADALAARAPAGGFHLCLYTDADELGGAEGVLADLAERLDPRIEVTVMGVDAGVIAHVARRRPHARTCLVPPVRDKRDVRAILAQRRAIRRLRPDVFHANLRHPWSCQYGLAAALTVRGTKVVALEHLPTPPTARTQRLLKRATSRRLDAHLAVGERSARELERLIGLPERSIEWIHNGVAAPPRTARERDGAGRPTVVAIGRMATQKGFDVLLRALAEAPEVDLEIVGDGPERAALERLRDELGLDGRVRMSGWASDASARLGAFDALVLSSRFEAFPLVVLEAMHAGLPVVATDVGSVAEAVADGESGLLVPAEDPAALAAAIRRVVDPSVGPALGARGRALARERFTLDRMAHDYELVYRRLLG